MYRPLSSCHQSAVARPCISLALMSSAIGRSPAAAKRALAQQVFEPTSRIQSPGCSGTVWRTWFMSVACAYQ